MRNKIRRTLLCLLAVSTMTVSANIYAENEGEADTAAEALEDGESEDGEAASEEKAAKLKESEEKVRAGFDDITKYLRKVGSADGIDIYAKDKGFEDDIWAKNGGEPEKKSDYTEAQEAIADMIGDLKKLGDLVAVDPEKKTALADFGYSSKCDEGRLWVSGAKRYLLYTDADLTRVIRIRRVISTIDDPTLFSSIDGKTLERMDSDYKKVLAVFTESGTEDGKKVYYTDDRSAFTWLTADGRQVIGTYRQCAENDSYILLVDDRLGNLGLNNKQTGYIWWSSPLGAARDKVATPLLVNELRSSNTLRYGIPSKRSNNNVLRSGTDDCEIKVSDVRDGVRVTYYYKAGFSFPVEYTLEKDCLKASLKVSEIKEPKDEKIATEVTLLNSFGAASDKEDGCFVIPDGSGALVRFNNDKTMDTNAYQQRVYGNDVTAVPTSRGAVTEQIYLPVYGIVKDDNALLAVASKGDSNAYLTAQVSKQSNSSYNLCNFTFILRGTDTFYMSGSNSDKLTVFESGAIKSDDIELRYYPISKQGASYVDVADRYRQYLIEEEGIEPKTSGAAMYVDLYGGTMRKKPVLGIPVSMKQPVTKYGEALEILTELKNRGVDDMVVTYNGWTNDGIKRKVDTGASPSGTLGGKSDFSKLTDFIDENDIGFYPASSSRDFYSGNGYYSFTSTCVRVSGSYSRIVSYDRAYGIPDGFRKNMSLLSPSCFGEVYGDIAKSYAKAGLSGAAVDNAASSLYGDYGKKNISRCKAMTMAEEAFGKLGDSLDNGFIADGANAYALPYISHITDIPLSSSRFDIFNEDVPFYQIVMHGLIPYSTTPVNGDADPSELLLRAAATGSCLSYDMIYNETSKLKDTDYDKYYYANYHYWADTAAEEYKLLAPLLGSVSDSTITGYDVSDDGSLITTTFSNGTVVKTDLEAKTVEYGGKKLSLADSEEGGIG
ncbi:MAG: hypothetical protein K6G82_05245 [Ruminococcus sp.]|nr:hypothetical protein [Ruminococcus sp.]